MSHVSHYAKAAWSRFVRDLPVGIVALVAMAALIYRAATVPL